MDDTLYLGAWRASKRPSVACSHYSSVVKAMRRSSTHWSKVLCGYFCLNSIRSALGAPSNDAGGSLKPFSWSISPISSHLFPQGQQLLPGRISFPVCLQRHLGCCKLSEHLAKVEADLCLQIPLISETFSVCLGLTVCWVWEGQKSGSMKVNS